MPDPRLAEHRRIAQATLSTPAWDYIDGGSWDEVTLSANRRAFTEVTFRPRMLVDTSTVDTTTHLFGATLAAPIGIAPTAYHRLAHPEGEVATAIGAGTAGALFIVSTLASRTVEDIAAAATGPLWLQVYWLRRRDALAALADRAIAAGYRALVVTVDAPVLGRRWRDERNGFTLTDDVRAVNLDAALNERTHQRQAGSSALAAHASEEFESALTWADLGWLRARSPLPVLVKGILTGSDARRALDAGVDGIVVSNHGGRQLDRVSATLSALPEVVDAVAGRCPVLVDGGVRDGGDVFAALALGATAALVGRPVIWSLCAEGSEGVAGLLTSLRDDLVHTMRLAGRPRLADIDRDAVGTITIG